MFCCQEKIWVENPKELLCNAEVIPMPDMSLSQQLNSITRLIFLISFILFTLNIKISVPFLILSLLFIIILYYIQKRTMNTAENFEPENRCLTPSYLGTVKTKLNQNANKANCPSENCNLSSATVKYSPFNKTKLKYSLPQKQCATGKFNNSLVNRPQSLYFCAGDVSTEVAASNNQLLHGPPNPKTLIAPVIVPPPAALDYWRANNLINHSHINIESQHDTFLSGYDVSNSCGQVNACLVPVENDINGGGDIIENYIGVSDDRSHDRRGNPNPYDKYSLTPTLPKHDPMVSPQPETSDVFLKFKSKENFGGVVSPQPSQLHTFLQKTKPEQEIKENFRYDLKPKLNYEYVGPNENGYVNTTCGYNPEQLYESNLPTNLATGNCERDPRMSEYNKNLFTQNIQPDIYTRNEIIEPINSNIGISFTQQFEPTTCSRKDGKGLTFTEHDPRLIDPSSIKKPVARFGATEANVYDPRFSGYGTSYRAYNEKVTGQTRFMYDDINAVRMPNYLVRSNIDFAPYADSYGPLSDKNSKGNIYNNEIRALAQDTFLRNSLQHRTELQERLMRKRNSEMWQTRMAPKYTSSCSNKC